jgi:beta-1,4-mannosyl-glycoprotein beta-1,4-N-acetylglucosaminyltransferase
MARQRYSALGPARNSSSRLPLKVLTASGTAAVGWLLATRLRRIAFLVSTIVLLLLYGFSPSTGRPAFPSSFHKTPSLEQCERYASADSEALNTPANPIDFLPLQEATELCARHGLPVFERRDRPRKVYDLFLFNAEFDWLEIRLNELRNHVDHFIILESSQTFTGHEKPLYYQNSSECFSSFANKIVYSSLDTSWRWFPLKWSRERFIRNSLFSSVFPTLLPPAAPNNKDVILISDLDEIPRPETITVLRNCDFPKRTNLRSRFFYYSYQREHRKADWMHPQATWYDGMDKTVLPDTLRMGFEGKDYWNFTNSSWHCSSCFSTVAEMDFKIASFSHTEYNKPQFRDPAEIVRRVRNGLDLFDRPEEQYNKLDPVVDIPAFLMVEENAERFKFVLDRDPENANFVDYP